MAKDTAGGGIWQGSEIKINLFRENQWRHPEIPYMKYISDDNRGNQQEYREGNNRVIKPMIGE